MNKKRSPIWKMNKEAFAVLIKNCNSFSEVLEYFGFDGRNFNTLRRRLKLEGVDYKHLQDNGKAVGIKNIGQKGKRPLSDILKKNSKIKGPEVKKRLIEEGILEDRCSNEKCSVDGTWLGEKITLQLDHINGIHDDSRLENLRLLCPNCHTQTETWGSKRGFGGIRNNCVDCGKFIRIKRTIRCIKCHRIHISFGVPERQKIKWPSAKSLEKQVLSFGYEKVGRKLSVTGAAVKKFLKRRGIIIPRFNFQHRMK